MTGGGGCTRRLQLSERFGVQSQRTPLSAADPELDQESPDQLVPDHDVPLQLVPDQLVPFQAILDHDRPDHERPDHDVPDHDVPDHDVPDHEVPDHEVPDQLVPFQSPPSHRVGTSLRLSVQTVSAFLPLPTRSQVVRTSLNPTHGLPMMSCSPARTMPLFSRWSLPRDASSVPAPVDGV